MRTWGFLTNHAHVLIQIARSPRSTGREIALATGLTERAAINVLHDLRAAGIVNSRREGRQNVNSLDLEALAKHRSWGASPMDVPKELIEATLRGLSGITSSEARAESERAKQLGAGHTQNGHRPARRWGFLTTHALVLVFVTQHPHSTVREIALAVGVTERAAHSVLLGLREAKVIERERVGRRNSYTVSFYHLSEFRREGTAPGLVPDSFVSPLIEALRPLPPPDYTPGDDEPHPVN